MVCWPLKHWMAWFSRPSYCLRILGVYLLTLADLNAPQVLRVGFGDCNKTGSRIQAYTWDNDMLLTLERNACLRNWNL